MAAIAKRRGVQRTSEFERISALPRREWEKDSGLEDLRLGLTEMLRLPAPSTLIVDPDIPTELWAIQAAALRDAHDRRGGFFPIGVGCGKAMISIFVAVLLEVERPLLMVPADLREQTNRKVLPQLKQLWRTHPDLKVIGNSELSLAKNAELLDQLKPDLIILDEVQEYKNVSAGRTKRMRRYMAEHPETIVIAMSGTISNRSLRDYHHIIQWCLGEDTPLPKKWTELCDWADAIDEGVPDQTRMGPGVLLSWSKEDEADLEPLAAGRCAFRRRLTETPGVVSSGEDTLDVALRIRKVTMPIPDIVHRMLGTLRDSWEDPNGASLAEAVDVWRIARQLALGFWYEWIPPGPRPWLDARKEWIRYVRETLRHNRRKLDTPLQVWNECERKHAGKDDDCEWCRWRKIKDTFKPNPVAQWLSFHAVDFVRDWFTAGDGICWVEHQALGERLSRDLGISYYGAGKKASAEILDAKGPIIASIRAHGRGKNLQQWNRNLILSPSSSGQTWEQMMGRTHRAGQKTDAVTFDVNLCIEEQKASFRQALKDARYLEDSLGGRQKLLYGDITFDPEAA